MTGYLCKNCNKWYDSDEYTQCPHCGAVRTGTGKTDKESTPQIQGRINKLFHSRKNAEEKHESSSVLAGEPIGEKKREEPKKTLSDTPEVHPVNNHPNSPSDSFGVWEEKGATHSGATNAVLINEIQPQNQTVFQTHTVQQPIQHETTDNAASASKDDDDGKTRGFFSMVQSERLTGVKQTEESAIVNEPVVGWIICVEGCCIGRSFMLFAQRNTIGRDRTNKVVISDPSVSREKHASIIYEPKKRLFYLQPGDESGLTYLNGEILMEHSILHAYDILELGKGRYVFLPLCGEHFTWDDYL